MDECSLWMWTCLKWIPFYSHMEKELKTLEFGTSRLAMLISNVLGIDARNLYTWAFEIKNDDLKINA